MLSHDVKIAVKIQRVESHGKPGTSCNNKSLKSPMHSGSAGQEMAVRTQVKINNKSRVDEAKHVFREYSVTGQK